MDVTARHAATRHVAQLFHYTHLLDPDLRNVSKLFHDLAADVIGRVSDGPELTTCLRKLLEAKDCAVRAAYLESDGE